MTEHRDIPEPGETIQLPRSSWAPVFFALGVLGLVGGIYAHGFVFNPVTYSVVGAILVLASFRSMARGAFREFFGLPRRQRRHPAALPVETISLRSRSQSR